VFLGKQAICSLQTSKNSSEQLLMNNPQNLGPNEKYLHPSVVFQSFSPLQQEPVNYKIRVLRTRIQGIWGGLMK